MDPCFLLESWLIRVAGFGLLTMTWTEQEFWIPVHVQVCTLYKCFLTSVYISGNTLCHPPQGMHVCSWMHILFISVWERVLKGSASLCTCLWRGTLLFRWEKIGVCLCFLLFFDGSGIVCGCMCVYTHTYTHTARGVLRCEARGRDKTHGGEINWSMPGDGMRSSSDKFFSIAYFPSERERQNVWTWHQELETMFTWAT